MIRLRRFHLRASTFALRATADKSGYGGQVAATARQVRWDRFAATARQARRGRFPASARQACVTAVAVVLGGGSTLFACPVCFGAEETSMVDGARLGVMVMLAVLFAVQGGFVGFFLYLRRRAKRIADIELDTEWSELQGVSRTS